jgi:hypothetical protein
MTKKTLPALAAELAAAASAVSYADADSSVYASPIDGEELGKTILAPGAKYTFQGDDS